MATLRFKYIIGIKVFDLRMSEKEKNSRSGFRIKWADREIEYYGDSVADVFRVVFDHVKSTPLMAGESIQQTQTQMQQVEVSREGKPATALFKMEYSRISKDAHISTEQVIKTIKFETRKDFAEPVPILPAHPESQNAVMLVSYAIQVGLQKTPIQTAYLKKLLKGPNGYPLPGSEFGRILDNLRKTDIAIASHTVGRHKPFSLSKKGLEKVRELLKSN